MTRYCQWAAVLAVVGTAASQPARVEAGSCAFAEKRQPVVMELASVASPAPVGAVGPLEVHMVVTQAADLLVVRVVGSDALALTDPNSISGTTGAVLHRFANVTEGQGETVRLPLAVVGQLENGTLDIEVEALDAGRRLLSSTTLRVYGYVADGMLYYGVEHLITHMQNYILDLERSGSIGAAESLARRQALTSVRQVAPPAPVIPGAVAKPTSELVIAGKVRFKDHVNAKGGTGNMFPVIGMKLSARDKASPDAEIASGVTNRTGEYTMTIAANAIDATADAFTLVLKAETVSSGFDIMSDGAGGTRYTFEKEFPNITNQASVDAMAAAFNIDFTQTGTAVAAATKLAERAWAVHSAMFLLNEFEDASTKLTGADDLPCDFPVGGTASFYSRTNKDINILEKDFADYDVIFHEYGHFFEHRFDLTDVPANPAGTGHSSLQDLIVRYNKAKGIGMAWSEGLATAFAMCVETEGNYGLTAGPRFGNHTYDDSEDASISYPAETEGSRNVNISEGNEAAVMRTLFDFFDGSGGGESFDRTSWGFDTWATNIDTSDAKHLDDFWDWLVSGGKVSPNDEAAPSTEVTSLHRDVLDQYAPIYANDKIAPLPVSPKNKAEFDAFAGDEITFKFKQNINTVRGGMKFRVLIFDSGGTVHGRSDEVNGNAGSVDHEIKMTKAKIDEARTAAGEEEPLFWTVAGVDTADPDTGVYVGPPLPIDPGGRIIFVIDDTGSMGGEIDAIKQGLLNFLARFDAASTDTRFQLITFKDDVSARASTTDLAAIQGQVSGLSASGGGDFPEASVEALWVAGILLAVEGSGGTVFLATDAPPHDGLSIPATVATLRAAGIRVNIILTESGFSKDTDGNEQATLASKPEGVDDDEEEPTDTISTEDLVTFIPDPAFEGSTDAYGAIADGTGGIFLGIAKGDAARMEAAVENLTAGGIFPAIVQVLPKDAPAGATLDVIIQGQNTNFLDTTAVAFGGEAFDPGITVNSVARTSPIELVANISIPDATTAGLSDVSATSEIETATGVSVFEITGATEAPTVLSVTPFVGVRGETLDVTITGLNTNWADDSTVTFGDDGVTVNGVTAVSAAELVVNITIGEDDPSTPEDEAAGVTFRAVSVTTADGTETATRGTAFRVAGTAAQATASVTAIDPNTIAPGSTGDFTLTGSGTSWDETATVTFSGEGLTVNSVTVVSATELTVNVTADEEASAGFRDVFVATDSSAVTGLSLLQVLTGPDSDEDGTPDAEDECDDDPDKIV
ncbi:MAG: VWA domain-containing protein, partial [bacterium]|nr:VWA domain-containing protein [bacterium]